MTFGDSCEDLQEDGTPGNLCAKAGPIILIFGLLMVALVVIAYNTIFWLSVRRSHEKPSPRKVKRIPTNLNQKPTRQVLEDLLDETSNNINKTGFQKISDLNEYEQVDDYIQAEMLKPDNNIAKKREVLNVLYNKVSNQSPRVNQLKKIKTYRELGSPVNVFSRDMIMTENVIRDGKIYIESSADSESSDHLFGRALLQGIDHRNSPEKRLTSRSSSSQEEQKSQQEPEQTPHIQPLKIPNTWISTFKDYSGYCQKSSRSLDSEIEEVHDISESGSEGEGILHLSPPSSGPSLSDQDRESFDISTSQILAIRLLSRTLNDKMPPLQMSGNTNKINKFSRDEQERHTTEGDGPVPKFASPSRILHTPALVHKDTTAKRSSLSQSELLQLLNGANQTLIKIAKLSRSRQSHLDNTTSLARNIKKLHKNSLNASVSDTLTRIVSASSSSDDGSRMSSVF